MVRRPRAISAFLVVVLALGLVIQPTTPISGWHLRWPKVHLPFDGSTPFKAVASIIGDIPHAAVAGTRYLGTATDAAFHGVESLFTSNTSHASTSNVSAVSSGTAGPPTGATELTTKRTSDSSIYLNPDGTYTGLFEQDMHYKSSNASWQNVDLSLRP